MGTLQRMDGRVEVHARRTKPSDVVFYNVTVLLVTGGGGGGGGGGGRSDYGKDAG